MDRSKRCGECGSEVVTRAHEIGDMFELAFADDDGCQIEELSPMESAKVASWSGMNFVLAVPVHRALDAFFTANPGLSSKDVASKAAAYIRDGLRWSPKKLPSDPNLALTVRMLHQFTTSNCIKSSERRAVYEWLLADMYECLSPEDWPYRYEENHK